eukprot:m.29690 g.29690  ORF g.29690 m.29690 type:complete len:155 (+) comp31210_c0_seq1:122-586(+)
MRWWSFVAVFCALQLSVRSAMSSGCSNLQHDMNCTCLTNVSNSVCGNCNDGCKLQNGRCVLKCGAGYAQLGSDPICVGYLDTSGFSGRTQTFSFGHRRVSLKGMGRNPPWLITGPTMRMDGLQFTNKDYVTMDDVSVASCSHKESQQWVIDIWI